METMLRFSHEYRHTRVGNPLDRCIYSSSPVDLYRGLTLHLGPYTTGEYGDLYSAVTPSYDPLLRDTYHLLMTGQICLEGLVHADPRIHSRAQLLMYPFARHILLARALLFQCQQLSKIIALAPSCRGC